MTALPLEGIRIFDLSRIMAGPFCTQNLADMGADVIKVERPGEGDDTRAWGPIYVKDADGNDTTESAYYLSANRNKRSITINISHPEGQALAKRLIAKADVLVQNFKVGGLKKYGLDYESLSKDFPGLVYCSISGYGQTGPYASRAGYDFMAQGFGGLMSVTGEPGGTPMKVGVAVSDIMCGMYSAMSILAALRHRDCTGEGQEIDCALTDTQIAWMANQASNYLVSGVSPGLMGNSHPSIVPYTTYETADGFVILAIGNDTQFRKWCEHAGANELAEDPRFTTNRDRLAHRQELTDLMAPYMKSRKLQEWIDGLGAIGVPAGPVNTMERAFNDPHTKSRDMVVELPHPLAGGGKVPLVANPVKMSKTPPQYKMAPPTLGQHTGEVLEDWLGLDNAEIDDLAKRGATTA
ncbi:MAG: CaiB/BaiF CoA-transferase family protein [Alphaproteobacteria bacterium]